MKIDFKQMAVIGFMWLLSFVLLMWVFSLQGCSSSYHLNKFYKKGGKIEDKKVEVTIHDTIHINGRDSIIEKSILVDCPEPKAPLTRWQTKYIYKYDLKKQKERDNFIIDSLNKINKGKDIEANFHIKSKKIESKTEVKTNPIRQIKSFILWAVLIVILLFVFNWISKR